VKRLLTKILARIIAFNIIFGGISITAFAQEVLSKVLFNGQTVKFDNKLWLDPDTGTLLTPIDPITDLTKLITSVFNWDKETLTISYGDTKINVVIGNKTMTPKVGKTIPLPVEPKYQGRTPYFPVVALFKALLGETAVYFDDETDTYHIMTREYKLPIPLELRVDKRRKDYVTLSWKMAGPGLKYQIYRNTQNDPESAEAIGVPVLAPPMVDRSIIAGETYYFWVSSVLQNGRESEYSKAVRTPLVDFTFGLSVGGRLVGSTSECFLPEFIQFIGTGYITFAPFESSFLKNTFFKLGINLGLIDNPGIPYYNYIYPFAQYNLLFAPFPLLDYEKYLKFYFGAGIGWLWEDNDNKNYFAINIDASLILLNFITISYTPVWRFRNDEDLKSPPSHNLSLGVVLDIQSWKNGTWQFMSPRNPSVPIRRRETPVTTKPKPAIPGQPTL